jgi:hypothetical protein
MRDDRDYKLDLSPQSGVTPSQPERATNPPTAPVRPYLSVHFACCNIYLRIYRTPDGQSYKGHCPRCNKQVTFAVGQGGTSSRIFRVE